MRGFYFEIFNSQLIQTFGKMSHDILPKVWISVNTCQTTNNVANIEMDDLLDSIDFLVKNIIARKFGKYNLFLENFNE